MLMLVNKIVVVLTGLFCVNVFVGFLIKPIFRDLKRIENLKTEIKECEDMMKSNTGGY